MRKKKLKKKSLNYLKINATPKKRNKIITDFKVFLAVAVYLNFDTNFKFSDFFKTLKMQKLDSLCLHIFLYTYNRIKPYQIFKRESKFLSN